MQQPLFSVLIANYNNGKYLMEAIESVRQQTYTHWEIVLVDDASTDNSQELYKDLEKDERIHIYYNEQNMGCGYTKRRCAELAQGEICGFLDPDDALLPRALYVSMQALVSHPQAVLTFSRFYYCDENLNVLHENRLLHLNGGESYYEHLDYSPEHFASFKKEAYFKTSGIDQTLQAAVDQDLYFKLEEIGQIVCLNELTYKYRLNTNGISQGKNENRAFYWNTIVRHNVCLRRKLPIERFSFEKFCEYMTIMRNLAVEESRLESEDRIRKTKTYKLGYYLLLPFKRIFRS